MTKRIFLILGLILVLGLGGSSLQRGREIDKLIAPYEAVMDKVNQELGLAIYIPEENREEVYESIKNMTPEAFESMLYEDYKTLSPSYKAETESKSDKRSYGVEKKSEAILIPNFSGPIPLRPLNTSGISFRF